MESLKKSGDLESQAKPKWKKKKADARQRQIRNRILALYRAPDRKGIPRNAEIRAFPGGLNIEERNK